MYVVLSVGIVCAFLTLIAEIFWKRRNEEQMTNKRFESPITNSFVAQLKNIQLLLVESRLSPVGVNKKKLFPKFSDTFTLKAWFLLVL